MTHRSRSSHHAQFTRIPIRRAAAALAVAGVVAAAPVLALAVAPPPAAPAAVPRPAGPLRDAVPGEIVIQVTEETRASVAFREDLLGEGRTGVSALDAGLARVGALAVEPAFDLSLYAPEREKAGLGRIYRVRYAAGLEPSDAARAFEGAPGVIYAEPNYIARAALTPNDPTYPSQWAHNNTGQAIKYGGGAVGTPDCDTDTDQAWDLQTGSSSLILAIIDTGVDTGHPEFSGRVVAGYDYVNNDANPTDDNGHGTSCAGIALGAGNNSQGIAGVAWGVKLMPVKVLDASGSGSYTAVANGITFAADNGAKILSLSLGGPASSTLQNAVNYAYNKGCALFCATGNANASSIDYPAGYSNTIAVGALSPCNQRKSPSSCDGETWWGSNYGTGIEFLAPGVRIHTTDIRGSGGFGSGDYITDFNGTSSATPHAAGIGALVWSQNPSLTNASLQTVLQSNCDDIGTAGYDTQTGYGRLNAYRAVQNAGGGGGTPVTLFSEGFEVNTVPGSVWSASDANATNGSDYWGDQSSGSGARVHGGTWSAYCADNSSVAGQAYDNYMNANMTLVNAVNVSGYTNVTFSFWLWYKTYNSSDYVSFQYWNGSSWVEQQRWSGTGSGWINPSYTLTSFTSFRFRYIFYSNSSGTSEGAYVDDILLTGVSGGVAPPPGLPAVVALEGGTEAAGAADEDALAKAGPPAADLAAGAPGAGAFAPLSANPNPATGGTLFRFALPAAGAARLEVFSVDGRRVASLVDDRLAAGPHAVAWSGRDASGRAVAAGVYLARLAVEGGRVEARRVVVLE